MSFPIDVQLIEGEMFSAPSSTAEHLVGTRGYCDERAFRYVKFGDDDSANGWATQTGRGVEQGMLMSSTSKKVPSVTVTTPTAGVKQVQCILGVDTTLDEYEGGYCFVSGIGSQWGCRITGNDAITAGSTVTFTLETNYPTTRVALSGTNFSVNKSPWMDVVMHSGTSGEDYASAVGVYVPYSDEAGQTLNVATEGLYGWIQTWGPIAMQANAFGGNATGERGVWGGNRAFYAGAADTTGMQYIGFLMQETASGTNADMPIVWLQIQP